MNRRLCFTCILLMLAISWSMSAFGQGSLRPLLEHDVSRTPAQAVAQLRSTAYWDAVVSNTATYRSWTNVQTLAFFDNSSWKPCQYTGWFASDGRYRVDGSWQIGTIVRKAKPGEQFACVNGTLVLSAMCGNPVRTTYVKEESPPPVCRDTGVEYGSVVVSSMGTATQTTWEFTPFECHLGE